MIPYIPPSTLWYVKKWGCSSLMTSVDLHLTPLFTEMNKTAPPKSCLKSSPARNEFKATLFLLCLKKFPWKSTIFKWMWLQRIVKIAFPNYVNRWTSRRGIVDKFNNSICNLLKVLAVVTAAWEFTTSEKFKISASFLRVDIRYRIGLQIFNNCDLLPRYICYQVLLFWKTFRQPGQFCFDNLCKRKAK